MNGKNRLGREARTRRFRQARWDEPIIYELSQPGARGILMPEVEEGIRRKVGDPVSLIPRAMRRKRPPKLPEIAQPQVLRHFLRLSQETLGTDLSIDLGLGGCTMKYNPIVHEQLARLPKMAEVHPLQPEDTVQGILEIMYEFEQFLKAISGMHRFSLQPAAGSAAIHANMLIIRAFHEARGEMEQRNEIITTVFSHPSNAASAKTAGFKVITLYPNEDGHPDLDALKAVISKRTAGLVVTNPDDSGLFNPLIAEFVRAVHEVGGLCCYDQANANGILGVTRAREAGFDLCHFNLHKTFSSPHGSGGPGAGAMGVTRELAEYLPVPLIEFDGHSYRLDYARPKSIGKVRAFYGVAPVVLRAYAWVLSHGAEGLREVALVSVLNNNYLLGKLREVKGFSVPFTSDKHRLDAARCSWKQLTSDTGVTSEDIQRRLADFGIHYWASFLPLVVPQPCTVEPTETCSRAELDEYVAILRRISDEAYADPEVFRGAPTTTPIHRVDVSALNDPSRWAVTWRAFLRKRHGEIPR